MDNIIKLRLDVGETSFHHIIGLDGRETISALFRFDIDVALPPGETLPEDVGPGVDATLVFEVDGSQVRQIPRHAALRPNAARRSSRSPRVPFGARAARRARQPGADATDLHGCQRARHRSAEAVAGRVGRRGSADGGSRQLPDSRVRRAVPRERLGVLVAPWRSTSGISFYFRHDGPADTIVFTDETSGFGAPQQAETIQLTDAENQWHRVHSFAETRQMVPSNYIVYDYNYRRPDLPLIGQDEVEGQGGGVIEYGGHSKDDDETGTLAQIRAQEISCRQVQYTGETSIINMCAGGRDDARRRRWSRSAHRRCASRRRAATGGARRSSTATASSLTGAA